MKRHRLQGRTKLRCTVSLALFILVSFPTLLCAQTAEHPQGSGRPHAVAPATKPGDPGGSSGSDATGAQPAPNVAPHPFLRFVMVLLSGLIISAAHLARKFRRFWGLHVFANPYAVLFLIFGVGLCGIPVTSEGALTSLPHVGFLSPWIADLSGIVVWLILPTIRLKPQGGPAGESQVRDLESASSSNPILFVIEDAIRDRILARMQSELVTASRGYNWETIKLAARRTLEEEMAIGRLGRADGDAALQSVEAFQADADLRRDSNNKYTALLRLLRWCSFSRLRDGLAAAARETHP